MNYNQSISYIENLIEEIKEEAYSDVFKDASELSKNKIDVRKIYKENIIKTISSEKIGFWKGYYDFPENEFVEKIDILYEKQKEEIEKLFQNADCLTHKAYSRKSNNYYEKFNMDRELLKEDKFLFSNKSLFPLKNVSLAFFSDGKLFVTKLNNPLIEDFRKLASKKGYEVKEIIEVRYDFIDKVHVYAQNKYEKELVVRDIEDRVSFVNRLFENDNICLTASNSLLEIPEGLTDYIALFSDGRYIVSKETRSYIYEHIYSKIEDFENGCYRKKIFYAPEYVPAEYIKAIYKKAKSFDWYMSEREMETYLYSNPTQSNLENKTIKQPDIDHFFEDGNICLTATKEMPTTKYIRESLAFFKDGRLLIKRGLCRRSKEVVDFITNLENENIKFQNPVIVSKRTIERIYEKAEDFEWFVKLTEEVVKKEYPDLELFIEDIFKDDNKCLTLKDMDKSIQSDRGLFAFFEDGRFIVNEDRQHNGNVYAFEVMLKRKMPEVLVKKQLLPLKYLEAIYKKADDGKKTYKEIYFEILKKKAKNIKKTRQISHHEALEVVAKLQGFNNWKEVCVINEDFAMIKVKEDNMKADYVEMFSSGIASENLKELDVVAKKQGFRDWQHLQDVSYKDFLVIKSKDK